MTQPGSGALADGLGRVAELERALDAKLEDRREVARLDPGCAEAAQEWARAVWACAEAAGPATLLPAQIDRGLAFARRPVFVCGTHRSGTTLLRDLLDGHPALVTLPSESEFHTRYEPLLARLLPERQEAFVGQRWLQRIANPNNQPPFWLLGRSDGQASPYVDFAREFRAWWEILQADARLGVASWPLAALALAWAGRRGADGLPPDAMWVDKTPTNERFLDRLWAEFPHAKVLHVVRRPDAVLASHKAIRARAGPPARGLAVTLRDLARSYRIALDRAVRAPSGRYHLVRYEDLVANRAEVMDRIAGFLGIEPLASLLEPTVVGQPATSNTAFVDGGSTAPLTALERDLLALAVGRSAAGLGYLGIEPATSLGRAVQRLPGRQAETLTTTTWPHGSGVTASLRPAK